MAATILESLKGVSGYPVPVQTLTDISAKRGLAADGKMVVDILNSAPYRLATADIMQWVSFAPNVQQGGVSYDILYSDRQQLRAQANAIYGELGDGAYTPESKVTFGYKGSRL
jgi:hypothetical protein